MNRSTTPTTTSRAWPLLVLAGFTLAGPLVGATALGVTHAEWQPWLAGEDAAPVFVVAAALLAGLSLLPTHAVSLVGGMAFGAVTGTMLATLAIFAAALLAFFASRPLARAPTTALLSSRPRAAAVQRALLASGRRRAATIIALVRLSPVMPFALTNLLMAGVGTGLREFTVGTLFGLMPRIAVVAVAGSSMAELDLGRGGDAWTLAAGVLATVVALAVIGRIARRALTTAGAAPPG